MCISIIGIKMIKLEKNTSMFPALKRGIYFSFSILSKKNGKM